MCLDQVINQFRNVVASHLKENVDLGNILQLPTCSYHYKIFPNLINVPEIWVCYATHLLCKECKIVMTFQTHLHYMHILVACRPQ